MTVIRGAISIPEDNAGNIIENSVTLYEEIIKNNPRFTPIMIIASLTDDLKSYNPCTALRKKFNLNCALECFQEAKISDQINKTVRLSVFCQEDFMPKYIYSDNAAQLREDLTSSSTLS